MTAGYNAEGLRGWKQSASGTTYFLYDGLTPIAEADASGTVQAVNTVGANGLASRRSVSSNSSVFYTFDLQGGTAQRLDSSGNVLGSYSFDAYGTRTSTDNSTDPYSGYGAQWGYSLDSETGWQLCGQRYYLPGLGRFLNRDPIGYNGGLNLYAYVDSNPFADVDPEGLQGSLQECDKIHRRIKNIQHEIDKRIGEFDEDKLKLPWRAPGDTTNGSLSRWGHEKIINELKRDLEAWKTKLFDRCGGDPPRPPLFAYDRVRETVKETAETGAKVGTGVLIGVAVWEVFKWGAAVIAAGPTGGCSLVAAGATP